MNTQKPQIPVLVAAGLTGLNNLFTVLGTHGSPSEVATVESHLSRFKLWAGSLGAHRVSGTRSLEYRLRDASSIRKHLVSLLEDLRNLILTEALPLVQNESIQDAEAEVEKDAADDELAAYFDEDDDEELETSKSSDLRGKELKEIFFQIGGVVDCLLRLSVTISNPAPHDRFKSRAGAQVGYYEPWDIQHVREKFPHIDEEIAKRLGRALTHRRRYFKYRESHYCRLKEGLEGDDDDGMSKGKATTVASSLPQQLKDADAQNLEVFDGDRSEVSETVYAPSTLNQGQLRVPPIPKEYTDGPFLCPFCYVFISVDSRHEWKKHVFRDLRPYICLSKTCVAADQDFQRRRDWSRHMFEEHWREWNCPFGCVGSLTSSSMFRQHLANVHGEDVSGDKIRSIISLGSQADLKQSEGTCPLCHKFEMKANRRARSYESHIGYHLEQLALFVLPFQDDNDGDSDHEKIEDEEVNSNGHDDVDKEFGPQPDSSRQDDSRGNLDKESGYPYAVEERLRRRMSLHLKERSTRDRLAKWNHNNERVLGNLTVYEAGKTDSVRRAIDDHEDAKRDGIIRKDDIQNLDVRRVEQGEIISHGSRRTIMGVNPVFGAAQPPDNDNVESEDDDDVYTRKTRHKRSHSSSVLMYLAGARPDDDPQAAGDDEPQ